MEWRMLQYFYEAALAGNFTRAAEKACVSQSALSQAIQALEKDLGCRLFERGRRVHLTPAGDRLREYCRGLFLQVEDIREELQLMDGGVCGTVRAALLESVLIHVLPEIIASFSQRFPRVEFSFDKAETDLIHKRVLAGDVQFGLVSRKSSETNLESIRLKQYPHALMVGPQHAGGVRSLSASLPLFLLGTWQLEAVKQKTDFLERYGGMRVMMPINCVTVVRQFVARGLGMAILPIYAAEQELRIVKRFPELEMNLFLIRNLRRRVVVAGENFMTALIDHFRKKRTL
jgi:DNA-binding transcriptional LysR family regulator